MYTHVHPVFRYMPPHPAHAAVAVQELKRSTVLSDTSPAFQKPFPKTQRGSTWGKTQTTAANRSTEAFLSMTAQRGETQRSTGNSVECGVGNLSEIFSSAGKSSSLFLIVCKPKGSEKLLFFSLQNHIMWLFVIWKLKSAWEYKKQTIPPNTPAVCDWIIICQPRSWRAKEAICTAKTLVSSMRSSAYSPRCV